MFLLPTVPCVRLEGYGSEGMWIDVAPLNWAERNRSRLPIPVFGYRISIPRNCRIVKSTRVWWSSQCMRRSVLLAHRKDESRESKNTRKFRWNSCTSLWWECTASEKRRVCLMKTFKIRFPTYRSRQISSSNFGSPRKLRCYGIVFSVWVNKVTA